MIGKPSIFNRPGVAGVVLQTSLSFIQSVSPWAFSSQSSRYHKSQTIRARELKFWENVRPQQHVTYICVTCHMLHVIFHVSHVTCHMSQFFLLIFFFLFFLDKVVKLIGGGSVINRAYHLPLVYTFLYTFV